MKPKRQKITEKIFLYKDSTSCFTYLIDDEKKVLIDAGTFPDTQIDLVVITHCHFDHILFLNEIKQKFNCKIAVGKKDAKSVEKLNERTLKYMSTKNLVPVKIDMRLKDGDMIKTGKYTFVVIETPGHTPGSISLYERNYKILFSGDAWFGEDFRGKTIYPGGNENDSLNTLIKLKKLDIKFLLPGH